MIESQSDQQFIASVVGVPNCIAEGSSKEEAIKNAQNALTEIMAHSELVTIEIESPIINQNFDPWLKHFGIFANDTTFDNFLEEISAYRQQVDEAEEAKA